MQRPFRYQGNYIGWIGYDNLGDEAMFHVCRELLSLADWWSDPPTPNRTFRSALKKTIRNPWAIAHNVTGQALARLRKVPRVAVLGGGTILNEGEWYLKWYSFEKSKTNRPVPVFGSGVYHPGQRSYSTRWIDRAKQWVDALADLPEVGVRGPLSKALLEDAGAKNVVVCGDPAVAFLQPISSRDYQRRLKIGINCGMAIDCEWGTPEHIQELLVAFAKVMVDRGHDVEVFSVHPKDTPACQRLVTAVPSVRIAPAPLTTAPEFLQHVDQYDVVIALRLHAGILAAAANVPNLFLEYQNKHRDFSDSIGWQNFSIKGDATASDLLDRFDELTGDLQAYRVDLHRRMMTLTKTFDNYVARIGNLLFADSQPQPANSPSSALPHKLTLQR